MARLTRNSILYAQLEATYGVAPGTFAATDAILMTGTPKIEPVRNGVKRDLLRGYFGGSEELVGARVFTVSFTVEMAGSGTPGVPAQWGKLLRGCSHAETITTGGNDRVEYTPITNGQESMALRWDNDGVRYQLRGCRGTAKLNMMAYDRPTIDFTFTGFDVAAAVVTMGTANFAAWKRPLIIQDGNSSGFRLAPTYSAGALTGGTTLISRGITVDIGNQVEHMLLTGGESVDIVGRETTGSGVVELTAADEVIWYNDMNTNVLSNIGVTHGDTAGNRITYFATNAQRLNNKIEDYKGRSLTAFDLAMLPGTGNDDYRIVTR